jgi:VanZ family protein
VTEATRRWLAWLPAVACATAIFVLSSQPVLPSPGGLSDKTAHAIAYGVLGTLCLVGVTGARLSGVTGSSLLVAFVLAVLYGASDEFHQSFVPGRSPEWGDLLADAVGAALALGLVRASAILLGGRPSARRP